MAKAYRSSSPSETPTIDNPTIAPQSPQAPAPAPSPISNSFSASLASPASLRFDSSSSESVEPDTPDSVDISVVMPCLNESRTLPGCLESAHAGLRAVGLSGEIIIADNGSTDGSQELVRRFDRHLPSAKTSEQHQPRVRVIDVAERGYGAALLGGIAAARGKFIVMADADGSYDFGEIARFIEKLDAGYDLVMGNRFAGRIMPGAMPWHHRYIGNPLLSGLGRLLYRTPCRDWHCGLRAFDRERINALHLRSTGMEFATEMVIRAQQNNLRITEIPITLHPDGRDRRPLLRSVRDGLRHLWAMARSFFRSRG